MFPKDISLDTPTVVGVRAIATQPDGKILVGGFFTSAGGRTRRSVVRINPDSTIDTTFNDPGITDYVFYNVASLAVQLDGKILVGGDFRSVNGLARRNLIRLNADGTLDNSFSATVSDTVSSIIVQPDGRILIGGFFNEVEGQTRNRLARLNANGSFDASFNRGSDFPVVFSMVLLPDGKILAPGGNGLARFNKNGTLDASFQSPNVSSINSIVLQPDGKIVIGGGFFNVNGNPRRNIARFNDNGTLDTTFQDSNIAFGSIADVVVQPDGKILIAGDFTPVSGQTDRRYLARLNADGTFDTPFNPLPNNTVYKIILQPDTKILAGGDFREINGITVDFITRLLNGNVTTCNYSINPLERTFPSAGGSNNFTVTTDAGCTWTATSNAAWLTVTSGTPGNGNGMVNYSVDANPDTTSRTATFTIIGQN